MKKIILTQGEKSFLMALSSAIIVSFALYYSNLGCIQTRLDLYILEIAMVAPFLFPAYMYIYHHLWRPREL